MKVRKREGYLVDFDKQKIINAISKAGQVSDEIKNRIADYIENIDKDIIDVEEIQDIVERKLMTSSYKDVAKAYINYRYLHKLSRDKYKELMDIVSEKLGAKNVQNQNANIDEYSFGGRVGEMSDAIMKKYALDYIVSETSKNNHLNNEVYIHDLGHYPLGDHNCFNRNTKFITKQGVKSFSDFKDGSVVEILCMDGVWRVATVHMYGKQNMQKVTLSRCGKSVDVVCTKNHRWILSDSSVTDDLKVGDRLFCLNSSVEDFSTDYDFRKAEMFCLGFIIGDGCDHKNKITVRLCGDKTKYAPIFEKALYNRIKVKDSSDCIYSSKKGYFKQSFLTNHMWRLLSFEDKVALFTGYLCADGSQTTNTKIVWTSDERVLAMIKEISCLAGYHIFDIKRKTSSTNFMVDRTLYKVVFTVQYSNNSTWVVTNIKNLRSKQEAWCVSEPVTKSFTLDGGIITGNCLSIPFDDLLANGFNTRQTDVRPAKSVNTAFQLVAVLFQLQSLQQFGGVSATHLDWTMVPYVRLSFAKHFSNGLHYCEDAPYSIDAIGLAIKPIRTPRDVSIEDEYYTIYPKAYKYAVDMTTKEVKQAVEGMYHNLNTLQSRSGNQLPFTSVNYGTCTLPEGRMIIKALLDVSIEGIGKLHKTSIFPCGIFKCKKGINLEKGDANYDLFQLALKSTSLRLYPNYSNTNWSGNAGYDENDPRTEFSTMGCRTANGWDINGFGQLKDGRGNIAPTTIVLPTLAMEANQNVEEFMKLLDKKIAEAKDSLIERFEWIASQNPKSATFMYENNTMAGYVPEEGIRSALKHGTLAIGMLGMAETLQLLIGCDHTEEKGMALAKRICQLYKDRCKEFKEKYKLNFGVYYTPAENLCHTALKKFREKYGVIPNVSDKEFFTNSMHVPVWKKMTPFEKIDIESQLTGYSSAGCITYVELESSVKHNIEALETIVKYAMEKDIPYFAVNVPNDMCMECGYTDEINDACPMCGNDDIQRLRRVTGYLTGNYTTAFNKGKQQEAELRYKHDRSTL